MAAAPILAIPLAAAALLAAPQPPPVVAGAARADLPAATRGLILLGELGCTTCHAPGAPGRFIDRRAAPRLTDVGARVAPGWLRRFIRDPSGTKPGTTMPDMLVAHPQDRRDTVAEDLTHYLVSRAPRPFARQPIDEVAGRRGRKLFHEIGCVACHAPRDGDGKETPLAGSIPLGPLAEKYGRSSLREFLLAPHEWRPSGRMPDFHLTPNEADDLANFLLLGGPAAKETAFTPDQERVARGATLFKRGCALCHAKVADPDPAYVGASAIESWETTAGCMSGVPGPWPTYHLSPDQRTAIRAAVDAEAALSKEEQTRKHLAALSCIACHARGDLGGVTDARNRFFTTREEEHGEALGELGRLPPPLTGVGAKLRGAWLVRSIREGQRIRPYFATRMPGFGERNATRLAELLKQADSLPAVTVDPLPEDRNKARAIKDIGHELAGDQRLDCIACHTFAGRGASQMRAVDLVETTGERLRPEWFYHYMLAPPKFRSGTLMPAFWPEGFVAHKDLADGDAKRQIAALWYYLADGRNTRAPRGLTRPSMEIAVAGEAVMLRRSVQDTGKRGISVGYPHGVNITFDAETIAMNQVWWGRFIDPAPVWTGQGSGQARILSRERVTLPKGPAFGRLADGDAPWPAKTRRELGHRFKGYDLDATRRPTFSYVCEGVTIRDTPREVPGRANARATLQRTLELAGPRGATLWFRAAVAKDIATTDAGFAIGRDLLLRAPPDSRVVGAENRSELRVPVTLTDGKARLVLTYTWRTER